MRKLEKYNPFFIEDPIAPDCTESLKSVRSHTNVPIAFGELYKSRWECLPGITNRWLDFIMCDLIRIGGITEARKIGAIAETYDVKTAWHGPNDVSPVTHAVNWHLNVSAYNFGIQEDGTVDDKINKVIKGGPVYRDGYLTMEDTPGLAVILMRRRQKCILTAGHIFRFAEDRRMAVYATGDQNLNCT